MRWMQMHAHCLPLWGMRLITEVVTPARRVATISRRNVKLANKAPKSFCVCLSKDSEVVTMREHFLLVHWNLTSFDAAGSGREHISK
jgi:hypothetical protein